MISGDILVTSGVSKRHKTTIAAIACCDFDIGGGGGILSDVVSCCLLAEEPEPDDVPPTLREVLQKELLEVLQFVFSRPWSSCSMLLLKSHGIVGNLWSSLVIFSHLWSSLTSPFFLNCQEIRAGLRKCTSIQVLDATLASARGKFRGLSESEDFLR